MFTHFQKAIRIFVEAKLMHSNTAKPKRKRSERKKLLSPFLNDWISSILEGSGQIAFDWNIPYDCLDLKGCLAGEFKASALDTMKPWDSRAFAAIIHEEDRPLLQTRLNEALKGVADADGTYYLMELRIKDTVRGWRWISISGRITKRDAAGRAVRMVGSLSDIHERKLAEARNGRLRDLYTALSQTTEAIVRIHDRESLFKEVCRIAVEHGRFDLAWIGLIDHHKACITPYAAHGASSGSLEAMTVPLDASCPQQHAVIAAAARQGRPDICNDLHLMLPAPEKSVSPSEYSSIASFPFMLDGKPLGVLNLYSITPHFFDEQLISLLDEMSRDISFAVDNYARASERKAMESELVDSEQFKSAILTAALDCIVSTDENGMIVSFNHAAEQTFGRKSNEVLGKNLVDIIIPPEWRDRHRHGVDRFLAADESLLLNRRIELSAIRADGTIFPIEFAVVPLSVRGERMFTAFIRDISDVKRSRAVLKDNAMRYRQLVELSPEAIFVYRDEKIALFNQAASRLLGIRNPSELLGRSIFDFVHPDHHSLFHERALLQSHEAQPTPFIEQVWIRRDGTVFNVEIGATNLMYNDMPSVQVVVRDITERKRAEALQLGQNRILNMIATGVPLQEILTAIARFVESQSDNGLCSILQLASDGVTLTDRIAPSLPPTYLAKVGDTHAGPAQESCGTAVYRAEPVVVSDIASDILWQAKRDIAIENGLRACASWPILGKHKKILGTFALFFRKPVAPADKDLQLIGICTNLAGIAIESRASDEKIRYLAHYDGLTSLPNRFLFKEYLDLALRSARRHGNKFAVLFLDLDKFKEVNDTLGHDAGDLVLCEIAKRLQNCLRHTDKIARMGGDEFYVLIEELYDGRYAADVAQKLLESASRPVLIGDRECRLSVSIGIAIYPDDGVDGQTLLKNADKAMYRAKDMGKNGFQSCSKLDPHDPQLLSWPSMQGMHHALLS